MKDYLITSLVFAVCISAWHRICLWGDRRAKRREQWFKDRPYIRR